MPRPRKRTATTPSTEELESVKRSKTSAASRSRQQFVEEKFSTSKLINWFKKYTTDDDPQTLGPEGMERFCEDIKVEPENIVMLVIAYRMQAKNMGYFTQCEWIKGLSDSEVLCDTPAKLQNKLNFFLNQLNDPLTFKSIFRFAYDFARVSSISTASLSMNYTTCVLGQRSALNGH